MSIQKILHPLVFAGLIANFMAMIVCFLFQEWNLMITKSVAFAFWFLVCECAKVLDVW